MTFDEFVRDYEPVPGADDALYLMCSCSDGKERFAQFAAQFSDLTIADLQQGVNEDVMKCAIELAGEEKFGTYNHYFDLLCKHFDFDDDLVSSTSVWAYAVLTGIHPYKRNDTEQSDMIVCKVFHEYVKELKNPSKGYYDFCDCFGLDPRDTVNSHRIMYLLSEDVVFSVCHQSRYITATDVQVVFSLLLEYFAAHAPNLNPTNRRYSSEYSAALTAGVSIEALAKTVSESEHWVIGVLQCPKLYSDEFVQGVHDAVISEATKEFDPWMYAKLRLKDLSKVDTAAVIKCKDVKECEALISKYF